MKKIHFLPLTEDASYLDTCWNALVELDGNGVHFSHRLCHDATDLTGNAEKAAQAREWVARLRALDREVWVWTHEIHEMPAAFLDAEGRLRFDDADWPAYLEEKYAHFLGTVLPGITGLVFTFAETPFEVYKDRRVVSKLSPAARLTRLMSVLVDICARYGVKVAIRDFVYRVNEVASMGAAIRGLPPEVIVMSKAVPHDWEPFYPPNPLLGAVGEREQWVEYDLGYEYEGQHLLPYANLEQHHAWMCAARARGIRQVCLRLDRYDGHRGQSALCTPWGRLMLEAFSAWDNDPQTPPASVAAAWETRQFPGAAQAIQQATQSIQLMMFPKKNWMMDHCRVPRFKYAKSHLLGGNADRLADWTQDPEDVRIHEALTRMPAGFREALEEEAALAWRGFEQANALVQEHLPAGHADAEIWQDGFRQLGSYLKLLTAYRDAFFRIREIEEHPQKKDLHPPAERALQQLRETAAQEAPRWVHRFFTRMSGSKLYHGVDWQTLDAPLPDAHLFEPVMQHLQSALDHACGE